MHKYWKMSNDTSISSQYNTEVSFDFEFVDWNDNDNRTFFI